MRQLCQMSGNGNNCQLTNIYTAVLVKNNNWPSSVHCRALMVGWEAAAVTLEVVYTVMCSISPIVAKERITGGRLSYTEERTGCQTSDSRQKRGILCYK